MPLTDENRIVAVELYLDELSALITVARNRYGWTDTEFVENAPSALRPAVAALYEAWSDHIEQEDQNA